MMPPLEPPINQAFEAFPSHLKSRLLELRQLIFQVAQAHPEIGQVTETLKWGQPSYLTSETGSGTTIRLGIVKSDPSAYGMFFHCQTQMVARIKERFADQFRYEGNRALLFCGDDVLPKEALKFCIYWALTYHAAKKKGP